MINQEGSSMRVLTTATAIAISVNVCQSSRRRTSALKSIKVRNAMNNPILAHQIESFLFSFGCVPTLKYTRIRIQNKAIHSNASIHKTSPVKRRLDVSFKEHEKLCPLRKPTFGNNESNFKRSPSNVICRTLSNSIRKPVT